LSCAARPSSSYIEASSVPKITPTRRLTASCGYSFAAQRHPSGQQPPLPSALPIALSAPR
jgi:hypothetical protein